VSYSYLQRSFSTSFLKMVNIPITNIKLKNTLIPLNNNNSFGFDEIPNTIVQVGGNSISTLSGYIFNKPLSQGKFPDRLKFSTVTPLFRNTCSSQIGNYRPISLFTSFSKTFEILIHQRLVQQINIHNIIFPDQFGFLEKDFQLIMQHTGLWN